MDMTKYIVYLGDKEIDYIYLGDKEIDYHQEEEQSGINNVWIIQADGNYDRTVPVCNLTIAKSDGTVATADDVEYIYVFKRFIDENISGSSATLVCNTSQNIDKVDQFGKRLTDKSEFENLFNDTGILLQSGNHKGSYDGYVIKFKKKIDFTSASAHIKHTGVNRGIAITFVPEPEGDIYRARKISTNQYTTAFDIIDFENSPQYAAPVTGTYTAMAPVTISIDVYKSMYGAYAFVAKFDENATGVLSAYLTTMFYSTYTTTNVVYTDARLSYEVKLRDGTTVSGKGSDVASIALNTIDTLKCVYGETITKIRFKPGISELVYIDGTNFQSVESMFNGCTALKKVNLRNFIAQIYYSTNMFINCSSLTSINLSNFNFSAVQNMASMFDGCTALKTVNLTNINTSAATSMNRMFANCSSLESLDLSHFNTAKVTSSTYMLQNVPSSIQINVGNDFTRTETQCSWNGTFTRV